jgi:hypothetical protein
MKIWQIFSVTALLILSGCALNPSVRTSMEPDSSLIVGYFDMSESPYALSCVTMTQDERSGIVYRQSCMTTLSSGLFYMENVPPMKYHIPFFNAGGKLHMISSSERDLIDVPPQSMVFIGPYKYKLHDKNLAQVLKITSEKYGLEPVNSPSKKEVLKMLLKEVKDPRWKQRIQQALSKMKE